MGGSRATGIALVAALLTGCSALKDSPYDHTISERSFKSASRQLMERAEAGDASAQYQLGFVNAYGEGVPADAMAAVNWLTLAAEQGHLQAQVTLATLYSDSRGGVLQDLPRAARWFKEAANRGHARSQFELGRMYQTGLGVPQDDAAAVRWLQAAADEDHPRAQYLLARAYVDATGVRLDPILAYVWARIARANGVRQSAALIRELESMLRPDELDRAESMAAQWLGQHPAATR